MDQGQLNNDFMKNFSNNAESNIYNDEQLDKAIKEQQDRRTKELEPLLSTMKKKMEEGSRIHSKAQSKIFNDNSIRGSNYSFNNSNISKQNQFNNNSQLGNNFNMNNINNINNMNNMNNMNNINNMNNMDNMNNINNNNFYNNNNNFPSPINSNSIHGSNNNNNFNVINNSNNNSKIFNMNNNSIHESRDNSMNNDIVESINLNNNNKYSNSNSMSNKNSKVMFPSQQGLNHNSNKSSKILDQNSNQSLIKSKNLNQNSNKSSKILNQNSNKSSKILNQNTNKSSKILNQNSNKSSKILNQNSINNSIHQNNNLLSQLEQKGSEIIFNNSKIYEKPFNLNQNEVIPYNDNNNVLPVPDEEQEKRDTIRKTQISIKHSLESSQYYEYETPGEKDNDLNDLLSDMSFYGEITKKEILREKEIHPDKFIPIDEAEEKGKSNASDDEYQNEYFVLSVLAKVLMNEGCIVVIERDKPNTIEGNNELNTTVQFLVNGMYNFKKYIFHFDFGEEKNNELIKDTKKQTHFNLKLKKKLLSLLKLQKNDIIMCNPRSGSYEITAIIKQNTFNELTEEQLFHELSKDQTFTNIKRVEYNILLSGCKLNPHMLDSRGDNQDGGWGINEKRGGKPYYPPQGWVGYGLRVLDRFDNGNNDWLDYKNVSKNEWAVAYHGVGSLLSGSQIINSVNNMAFNSFQSGQGYKNSNDSYHPGEKVGEGVYVTPQPSVMENHCGIIKCGDQKYKVGIMTRVKPELIRCPAEKQDYWVINGTDNEIRPYRILIKEV